MTNKKLKVKFKNQLDNKFNPYGSCNVTSIAMCLDYLGIKGDNSHPQLEDQLYQIMINKGWSRHNPYDLATLVRYKGKNDHFNEHASIQSVKDSINNNRPTVIHGWFTASGHIIECHGYNEKGLICHDPYGNYLDHYQTEVIKGKDILYTYEMITQVCMPDGNLWLHSIGN